MNEKAVKENTTSKVGDSWKTNLVVLQTIFENLDFEDVKTCSLVCRTWLEGSAKAFRDLCLVKVPNNTKNGASNFEEATRRFGSLHNWILAIDLNASERILTSLPNLSGSLTVLVLRFDWTPDILKDINNLLLSLAAALPRLHDLELYPNGGEMDDSEDASVGSQQEDSSAPEELPAHVHLETLRLRLTHSAMMSVKWRFLKSLSRLRKVHLLDFDCWRTNFVRELKLLTENICRLQEFQIDIWTIYCKADSRLRNDWWVVGIPQFSRLFEVCKPEEVRINVLKCRMVRTSFPIGTIYRELQFLISTLPKDLRRLVVGISPIPVLEGRPNLGFGDFGFLADGIANRNSFQPKLFIRIHSEIALSPQKTSFVRLETHFGCDNFKVSLGEADIVQEFNILKSYEFDFVSWWYNAFPAPGDFEKLVHRQYSYAPDGSLVAKKLFRLETDYKVDPHFTYGRYLFMGKSQ